MIRQAEDFTPILLNDLPSDDLVHRPVSTLDQNVWPDPADELKRRLFGKGYDSVDAAQSQKDFAAFLEVKDRPPGTLEFGNRAIAVYAYHEQVPLF